MAKHFETLYAETDEDGLDLEWEWDAEDLIFRTTDGKYTLTPALAIMTSDEAATKQKFEDLYAETDPEGLELDWQWDGDPEEMVFHASERKFILKPITGRFERESIDDESEDEVED